MKCILLHILYLLFCLTATGQAFRNPSFDHRDAEGNIADWTRKGQHINFDSTNAHTGAGCAYIYNMKEGISNAMQTIPFSPGKYKKYKLKLFIKTEARKGYAEAWVKVTDAKGNFVFRNAIPELQITGKTLWKQYTVDFYGTADVKALEAGIRLTGMGKAWFDDISIEALPEDNKTAGKIAKQYLGEVYEILNKQCWYTDSVDLKDIYEHSLQLVTDAKNTSDCYEGMAYIMDRLGDPRGQFYDPSTTKNWVKEQRINDIEALYPSVKMTDSHYVYILLPGITSMSRPILEKYADSLHQQLLLLDQSAIKGWVLDLRQNVGGNATAMLAAIGPLLKEGVCGKYIRSKETIDWTYKNGKAQIDTTIIEVKKAFKAQNPDLPVAVLTSSETYGAGELIVVAFKGREHCRSFGERTVGATANEKRIILSDGAMLFFTAGIMCDTKGQRYNGRIMTDLPVRLIYTEDHCLGKAMKWLKEQGPN